MTEEKKNGFHIPSIHVTKDLLRRMRMPIAIVLLILLADQVLKIWIKTHMQIGESIPMLGDWFKIYFVENFWWRGWKNYPYPFPHCCISRHHMGNLLSCPNQSP